MNKISDKFLIESSLYGDRAYTDYNLEDELLEKYSVLLKTQRKKNSEIPDSKEYIRRRRKTKENTNVKTYRSYNKRYQKDVS